MHQKAFFPDVSFWSASTFWERNTIFIYPGLCLFFGETCTFETPFVQWAARWSNLVWFPSTQYLTTTPFLGGFCLKLTWYRRRTSRGSSPGLGELEPFPCSASRTVWPPWMIEILGEGRTRSSKMNSSPKFSERISSQKFHLGLYFSTIESNSETPFFFKL